GGGGGGSLLDTVEVYSVTNNSWTIHPPMLIARIFHYAFRFRNRIYIIGGKNRSGPIKIIERYPLNGSMTVGSFSMFTPRIQFGAVEQDSLLFIIAGFGPTGIVRSVEVFNASREVSALVSSSISLRSARWLFVAAEGTANKKIYLFGGFSPDFKNGIAPVPYVDEISRVTSVIQKPDPLQPKQFSMDQNFPNPFNPSTNIRFEIPVSGFVSLKVYDVLGREVVTLVNERKSPGTYNVNFDASGLPSGIYLYQLNSPEGTLTKKMVLLK
ncbi:MAG: T9SS type A sorting domain-containing protein, partial [Bacteroidota bacterium]|nr:T9SS type A sorting domain-containing protein [Bacteroidota bacterium]